MRPLILFAVLLGLTLAACDDSAEPVWVVLGTVSDSTTAAAVDSAEVWMSASPAHRDSLVSVTTTDAAGRFWLGASGNLPDVLVRVEKPGYRPATFALLDEVVWFGELARYEVRVDLARE